MNTQELKRAVIKLEFLKDLYCEVEGIYFEAEKVDEEKILCGDIINDYLNFIYNNDIRNKIDEEIEYIEKYIKELTK